MASILWQGTLMIWEWPPAFECDKNRETDINLKHNYITSVHPSTLNAKTVASNITSKALSLSLSLLLAAQESVRQPIQLFETHR